MFFLDFKIKKGKAHYSSSKNENSHSKSNISVNEKLNVKPKALTKPPLTKKQLQIRYGIQYRFYKSSMKEYVYQHPLNISKSRSKSKSSDMEEYGQLKHMKVVCLKDFHNQQESKRETKSRKSIHRRLRIHTDNSAIKTQNSEKSVDRLNYLQPFLNKTIKNNNNSNNKWNLNSMEKGQKIIYSSHNYHNFNNNNYSYSNGKNKPKVNSHRTLTVQNQEKLKKIKNIEKKDQKTPKIKQNELKNYKF